MITYETRVATDTAEQQKKTRKTVQQAQHHYTPALQQRRFSSTNGTTSRQSQLDYNFYKNVLKHKQFEYVCCTIYRRNSHRRTKSPIREQVEVTAVLLWLGILCCVSHSCIISVQIWQCGRSLVKWIRPFAVEKRTHNALNT